MSRRHPYISVGKTSTSKRVIRLTQESMKDIRRRLRIDSRSRLGAGALVVVVALATLAYIVRPRSAQDPAVSQPQIADPGDVYDPAAAGEPLPDGYRQLLRRDMIHPVYDPTFAEADEVDWPDNTDVIGVVGEREAKAYPVSHLNFREMVIDEIEGIPILVSW